MIGMNAARSLSQDNILADLRPKLAGIEEALVFVLVPPPIRGLGQSGGFQMMVEDRADLGLAELQKADPGSHSAPAMPSPVCAACTPLSAPAAPSSTWISTGPKWSRCKSP